MWKMGKGGMVGRRGRENESHIREVPDEMMFLLAFEDEPVFEG